MGISDILGGLKDKVLDAAHFDLLKRTYDLQEENLKQLRASNGLLREKVESLEAENASLSNTIEELRSQFPAAGGIPELKRFSEDAQTILRVYLDSDSTELLDSDLATASGMSEIRTEAALAELQSGGIVIQTRIGMGAGCAYALTGEGKMALARQKQ